MLLKKQDEADKRHVEHEREFVARRLTSTPIADALDSLKAGATGAEADGTAFFFKTSGEKGEV